MSPHRRFSPAWLVTLTIAFTATSCTTQQAAMRLKQDAPSASHPTFAAYGLLPLSFEPNTGQTDSQVKFLARGKGYTLFLTPTEAVLALQELEARSSKFDERRSAFRTPQSELRSAVVRMQLVGANPTPSISGQEELPGKANYFLGNDPAKWRTDLPTYAKVKYDDIYPGIDLIFYGNQGQLEHDFILNPGANVSQITLAFQGVEKVALTRTGDLLLRNAEGELRLKTPVVYQQLNGTKRLLNGRYVRKGKQQVRFQVARYDRTKTLIIDPVLFYSTYLGGSSIDRGRAIATDKAGYAYVTGATMSVDFPTQNPLPPIYGTGAGGDAFVAKFNTNASGAASLVYSTYLGGSASDGGSGIAIDVLGSAYVTGSTGSLNFPVLNPLPPGTYRGGLQDVFVTKLSPPGNALVYSTYLGGSGTSAYVEEGLGIGVDVGGNAYVTGRTNSTDFPIYNAYQSIYGGGGADVFVTKLESGGSTLAYSTFLGGSMIEHGSGIVVDSSGDAYVTGTTSSSDFPRYNAYDPTLGGTQDAFVTKLSASGNALAYSTYLGGAAWDGGQGIAVDVGGNAYVTGWTQSQDFPVQSPFQLTLSGSQDAFLTKFNAAGSGLVYSTYLGGSSGENGAGIGGIAVNAAGNAYATGRTASTNFPTQNPYQGTNRGATDLFVTKFTPSGSALVYSSYLGGSVGLEGGYGLAVDVFGNAYVIGETGASDFPTANPFQSGNRGSTDAVVSKLETLPAGVNRYGAPTASCQGPIAIDVTETPRQGSATFTLTSTNGPPNASGLLVMSLLADVPGTPLGGIRVHLNLAAIVLILPVLSDSYGFSQFSIPIPPGTAGAQVYFQYAWLNTTTCGGVGTLSATDALAVTVQP